MTRTKNVSSHLNNSIFHIFVQNKVSLVPFWIGHCHFCMNGYLTLRLHFLKLHHLISFLKQGTTLNTAKLDAETEELKHKTVDLNVGKVSLGAPVLRIHLILILEQHWKKIDPDPGHENFLKIYWIFLTKQNYFEFFSSFRLLFAKTWWIIKRTGNLYNLSFSTVEIWIRQ